MSRLEAQYMVTPTTLVDGQYTTALCDSSGHPTIAEQYAPQAEDNTNGVIAYGLKPLASSTYAPTLFKNFTVTGAAAQLVKNGHGNLLGLWVRNTSAGTRYLQMHDTTGTPSNGTLLLTFQVATGAVFTLGRDFFGLMGVYFATGITLAS